MTRRAAAGVAVLISCLLASVEAAAARPRLGQHTMVLGTGLAEHPPASEVLASERDICLLLTHFEPDNPSPFELFSGEEIARAALALDLDAHEERLGLEMEPGDLGLEPLRGPPELDGETHRGEWPSYPKTRIGGIGLFLGTGGGAEEKLSLGLHWVCGVSRCEVVEGKPQDPLGLAVSIARNGTIVVSDERSAQGETFRVPYSWAEEHPDELLQLLTVVGGLDRSQAGTFLAKEGLSVKGEAANQFLARQASRDTNDLIEGAKKEWINQAKWAALGFGAGKVIQAGARGLRGALSVGDDVAAAAGSGIDDLARELAPRGGLQSLPKPTVPAPLPVPATPAPKVTGEALEDLRIHFDRTTKPAYWKEYARYVDDEVISNPFGRAETNLPRMRQGLPPIGPDGRPVPLHHIRPLSRGGTNEFENLVPFNQTTHQRYTKLLHNEPFPGVLYHLMIQ